MADALSDIVTLAGAFGSFTQSLATLHDTKVRVEKGLRAAQIERANNDFLQRFNLAYDDPNHLDAENWMDALVDHESNLEGFLVQTRGGKAVDAEVRAELMPITEGFTTAVGNKMIESTKALTQAKFGVMVDELLAAGKSAEEVRARTKREIDAGILDPERTRAFEVSLQKLEGSEYARNLMSVKVANPDGKSTRSTTPDEARSNIMSIPGMTEIQKASALSDIKAWQDGNSEELAGRTKRFDKARTDGNLSPSAILDMGIALKDSNGMVNDAEYDEASMAYFASMSQQSGITAERIANDLREMYGDEIPREVAQEAIGVLNNMLADKELWTSEERATTIKNEIERISNATIDGDKATSRTMNILKNKWTLAYKAATHGEGTSSDVAIVENEILRYGIANGIDVSSFLKEKIDAKNLPGAVSKPYFDAVLKDYKNNWLVVGQFFDDTMKADISAILTNPNKLNDRQIKVQSALLQAEKTLGDMLINNQMTNTQEIAEEFKKTAIMLLQSDANNILGVAKGLSDKAFTEKLATIASDVDLGSYDRFYTPDAAGNRPTPAAISATISQINQKYNERESELAKDGLIPQTSSMRVIADGADEYHVAPDGKIYARDAIGGAFTIRVSTVRFDEEAYKKDPKYLDTLKFGPPIKSSEERREDEAKALLDKVSGRGSAAETIQALIDVKKGELGNAKTDAARKGIEAEITNLTKRLETAKQAGTR